MVAETCDRVAVLYAGRIMETADVHTLFRAPAHPYTQGLIARCRMLRHARRMLSSISGAPPDPRELPSGCRFAPRCTEAMAACHAGQPDSVRLAPGHRVACLRAADQAVAK